MITIRRAAERGHFDHGWLDTYHTFSFGDYHDPRFMGFRALRVINEDRVAPGQGFGKHHHRDMEIVTWVLEGALAHEDSLGNSGVIRPGDVQRMSAGTGVTYGEFNASQSEPVHFLQIWILPERTGAPPDYEQKTFPAGARRGRLGLIGSRDGREGSVTIGRTWTSGRASWKRSSASSTASAPADTPGFRWPAASWLWADALAGRRGGGERGARPLDRRPRFGVSHLRARLKEA